RSEVLGTRRIRGGSGDDRRVLHGTSVFERALDVRDRRALLADGDVDAANLLVDVARLPVGLPVDDRVERDGRLARLAVADDDLTLTAPHGDHRVDRLDAGLQRLVHALTVHHAGGLKLELALALDAGDLAESVDRVSQRVDDATEVTLADRNREDLPGAGDLLALLDARAHTPNDRTEFGLRGAL